MMNHVEPRGTLSVPSFVYVSHYASAGGDDVDSNRIWPGAPSRLGKTTRPAPSRYCHLPVQGPVTLARCSLDIRREA